MNRVIHKHELRTNHSQYMKITLPKDFEILHVGYQNDLPVLWVSLPENGTGLVVKKFFTMYTGRNFDDSGLKFIGTAIGNHMDYHIYESLNEWFATGCKLIRLFVWQININLL